MRYFLSRRGDDLEVCVVRNNRHPSPTQVELPLELNKYFTYLKQTGEADTIRTTNPLYRRLVRFAPRVREDITRLVEIAESLSQQVVEAITEHLKDMEEQGTAVGVENPQMFIRNEIIKRLETGKPSTRPYRRA